MSNYLFSFFRRSSCRLRSQREATLAGTVSQGGDPPVVLVARAVEHDALDAGRLRPLGDELADPACLGRLVAVERAQLGLHRARRGECLADEVVDHLDAHVPRGAGDNHARPLRRTGDLLAAPDLATQTRRDARARVLAGLECDSHRHLPAFPTLRRICSPAYRTPLPLYGSGLCSLRMFAATSPTSCLSMPWTPSLVGPSTVKVIPSGASKVIGWEYPSWNSSWVGPFERTR